MAAEIVERLGLPPADRKVVSDAALIHHYPAEMLSVDTIGSVLAIMTGQRRADSSGRDRNLRRLHDQEAFKVLRAFHSLSLNQRGAPLPDVLSASNVLVERLESAPLFGNDQRAGLIDLLQKRSREGLVSATVCRAFASLPRPQQSDVANSISRLPVFPTVALQVLAIAASADVSFKALAGLVSKDQVLAGHLISAANSCLYSPAGKISTIGHAISYVGLEETRRLITAASVRPMFASGGLSELWKHSLEISRLCEELAAHTKGVSKGEAFLAGLVHDVGQLVAMKLSGEASLSFVRLLEAGCDRPFAEVCLFGRDHSELGADVLRVWAFPETIVDAVLHHHRPEQSQSALASLLYLAESRTTPEKAIPEGAVGHALSITGLAPESLQSAGTGMGLLESMCFAA